MDIEKESRFVCTGCGSRYAFVGSILIAVESFSTIVYNSTSVSDPFWLSVICSIIERYFS